jgi:hemolysin III
MSVTFPTGLSRRVNRVLLTATLAFGGSGLMFLALLAVVGPEREDSGPSLVYGLCLVACTLFSFLYNMREHAPGRKLLRLLDHVAIFLLIAGTYTPFAATGIPGPFGVTLLHWVWGLASLGIALKLLLPPAYDRIFVIVYLAIGWLFVSALGDVVARVPSLSLAFLAAGGVAYSVGAVLYARDIGRWTDPVWHSCVLTGAVTHFVAVVAFIVAPIAIA